MVGALAVAGAFVVGIPQPVSSPPHPKQTEVAAKARATPAARPVQKTGNPSARTHTIPRHRTPARIAAPEQKKAKKAAPRRASLPSCSTIRAQYERMSWAQRWAAYRSATPEQIAHGRRCLGQ